MKHIFTLSLCFLALSLSAYGQVPDYVPTEGLVGYWPLDGSAQDSGPLGLDGVVDGAVSSVNRFDMEQMAMSFDGTASITLPSHNFPNGLSVSIWIREDEVSGVNVFVSKYDGDTGGSDNSVSRTFSLYRHGESLGYRYYGTVSSQGQAFQEFPSIASGSTDWIHLVCVFGVGSVQYFVNGEFDSEHTPQDFTSYHTSDVPITVGSIYPPSTDSNKMRGSLDDLGIWNRALSETEIQVLYTAEIPISGCTDETACNFDQDATVDDGSCIPSGCMDTDACNFNSEAECEGEACDYTCCPGPGCCSIGHYWDWELEQCFDINPTDTNLDGCTDLNDLMDILANYGDCVVAEFTCGDDIEHEGYSYSTVQIGDQCWFSENCRYLPVVSPSSEGSYTEPYYYVYDYQGTDVEEAMATENYETYGVLYNWPSAITEGLCPSGWHVPTDGEFTQLTDFLGGLDVAGYAMKSNSGWFWGNGSNSSGFNGLPGGILYSDIFHDNGSYGYWWTSSEFGSGAWVRFLHSADAGRDFYERYFGLSARCIKD